MARMVTQQGRAAGQLLEELHTLREEVRLKLHLAGTGAKQEWRGLEGRLHEMEEQLLGASTDLSQATHKRASELGAAMRGFLARHAANDLRVSDVMTRRVIACAPHDRLEHAARIMWDNDCGVVPVIDGDGMVVGMLTDRDVCMAAYTQGLPLGLAHVASAMSRLVHTTGVDTQLREALRLMREQRVRRLPVIDAAGKLCGIVSLSDLATCGELSDGDVATTLASISARRDARDASRPARARG